MRLVSEGCKAYGYGWAGYRRRSRNFAADSISFESHEPSGFPADWLQQRALGQEQRSGPRPVQSLAEEAVLEKAAKKAAAFERQAVKNRAASSNWAIVGRFGANLSAHHA